MTDSPTAAQPAAIPDREQRNFGMLCHLAVFLPVPFGNVVGPLALWLWKREELPFVDHQGKQVLNFQLSLLLYGLIAGLLCFLMIGFLLLPALVVFGVVQTVLGAIRASEGKPHRYPLSLHFVR